MLPASLLFIALSAADPLDRVTLQRGTQTYELNWADAEDRLRGTLRPLDPLAGRPIELSLMVGPYEGPEFGGPLSMTLHCGTWSQTQSVVRAKDAKAWYAEFTPQDDGDCVIDVGWQSTRHKVVHAGVIVGPAPLSRLPWYVLMGSLAVLAIGFGIRAALKKPES